jgi:hypothetical protein
LPSAYKSSKVWRGKQKVVITMELEFTISHRKRLPWAGDVTQGYSACLASTALTSIPSTTKIKSVFRNREREDKGE